MYINYYKPAAIDKAFIDNCSGLNEELKSINANKKMLIDRDTTFPMHTDDKIKEFKSINIHNNLHKKHSQEKIDNCAWLIYDTPFKL